MQLDLFLFFEGTSVCQRTITNRFKLIENSRESASKVLAARQFLPTFTDKRSLFELVLRKIGEDPVRRCLGDFGDCMSESARDGNVGWLWLSLIASLTVSLLPRDLGHRRNIHEGTLHG